MDEAHLKSFRERLKARMAEDQRRAREEWDREQRSRMRLLFAIVAILGTGYVVAIVALVRALGWRG